MVEEGALRRSRNDSGVAGYVARIATLDPETDLTTIDVDPVVASSAVGTDVPRLDLPDKVAGRPRFVSDLRPEGLLYARVLRPPSPAARLLALPGGGRRRESRVVRDGSFLGVVGPDEAEVDRAAAALATAATWAEPDTLPDEDDLDGFLRSRADRARR